ncbi:Roadblock/LC7 family protein [Methanobacterium lacus]|uniref:Roadblock/LC7 family protein n=1 Tax=Methanobacterium lacus (strain AL-21) TaxID=877455 RepID=F0TAD7_METLA|nr:roadblock/LC7 family protein [Methanobacterium lacus]ADZ08889.1 Roadblock/LC7 family protein [Methanobacterium lacus]
MKNSDLLFKLERIVIDLVKVDGVDGGLIVDDTGKVVAKRMLQDIDIELFGPMSNVITSSSKRLFNSSHQGEIQRVLIESLNGKALFLNLENVHLIVLMKNHSNVGLILVSSKRAAEKIRVLSKDLKPDIVETIIEPAKEPLKTEIEPEVSPEKLEVVKSEVAVDEISDLKLVETPQEEPVVLEESLELEPQIIETESEDKSIQVLESLEVKEFEIETEIAEDVETSKPEAEEEVEEEVESEEVIPIIKPPIAFPDIKKITEVPEDVEARSELILDIYEAVFRAMSIGASKIMGVAPARGLTQKFLPSQECERLLNGVVVESNSTLNFDKIRENASKIKVEDRESEFIEDFTKILDVITDNYGKVMGYEAFRGMVRPEFKIIADSYGPVMNKLGIINKMHPEISELFGS